MSPSLREASGLFGAPSTLLEWEETNCLMCGSSSWAPVLEGPDRRRGSAGYRFLVVQCQRCGLHFTNPRPGPGSMSQFYQADYAPHWKAADDPRTGRAAGRSRSLRKNLPLQGAGRLLDFGCGGGSFVLRMQRQGWQVTGLDVSESAIQRLSAQEGVHALVGSLPHPGLEDRRFDVITMWQSLEHVHQPLEVLQSAHHLLADDGQLIVAVPNIASVAFRWFGECWQGLELPRHLTHFTPPTLLAMLHKAGFIKVDLRQQRRSGWLRSTAALAMRDHLGVRWLARCARSRLGSSLLSWYAHWLDQSDCIVAVARK